MIGDPEFNRVITKLIDISLRRSIEILFPWPILIIMFSTYFLSSMLFRRKRDGTNSGGKEMSDELMCDCEEPENVQDVLQSQKQRIALLEAEIAQHAKDCHPTIERLETELKVVREALKWIETVNSALDMRKLEVKTVIGMVYELRGKAKATLAEMDKISGE